MSIKNLFIIQNSTLYEILNEISLFKNYKINFEKDLLSFSNKLPTKDSKKSLCIFEYKSDVDILSFLEQISMPIILLFNDKKPIVKFNYYEIKTPFSINYFFHKINQIASQYEYHERSFIKILDLNLDINNRSISDGDNQLQLTEKEIEFILYLKNSKLPVTIDNLLQNVWKYSLNIETHTIETHVHRLRKKFLEKFNLKNIIKNNKKGYFI